MKLISKKSQLKNGQSVLVRSAVESDAEQSLSLGKSIISEEVKSY